MEKLIQETTEALLKYAKEHPQNVKVFEVKTEALIDECCDGYNYKPVIKLEFNDLM